MKTTYNKIKDYSPCGGGWKKLLNYYKPSNLDDEITIKEILKSNGIKDGVWALRCVPESELNKVLLFCSDVADSVISIFEKKYPEDKRPRKAIEAIRAYAQGEISKDELNVAAVDAYAAYASADASVVAAAYAAYASAASSAASAYAYAVASASAYAYAAAYASASAAVRHEKWVEITNILEKYIQ